MLNKATKLIHPSTVLTTILLYKIGEEDSKFGKEVTRRIMEIRSNNDFEKILNRYRGSFNAMHLTALLKKANRDIITNP